MLLRLGLIHLLFSFSSFGLRSDSYELVYFKLAVMTDATKVYTLIPL